MDLKRNKIKVREILAHPSAKALLELEFPELANSALLHYAQNMTLSQVLWYAKSHVEMEKLADILQKLEKL